MMENHIFKKSDGILIWSSKAPVPIELQGSDYIHKEADLDLNYDYKWDATKEEIVKGSLRTVDPAVVEAEAKLFYRQQRADEYPNWGVQLDYIYHNGIDKWKADIVDPIKAKYPKPS